MSARWNEGVAGRIKLTDGAIGYVEYGYAQRAGLALAALENKAGKFIEPSPSVGQATLINTQNDMPDNLRMFFPDPPGEDSYPIVTYSWLMLYGNYPDQKKGRALQDFVMGKSRKARTLPKGWVTAACHHRSAHGPSMSLKKSNKAICNWGKT